MGFWQLACLGQEVMLRVEGIAAPTSGNENPLSPTGENLKLEL
jgi:hypothetical protein